MPAIAAVPALVAAIIVAWQILRIAIPWRPQWTLPFIDESPNLYLDDLLLAAISKTSAYLILLWVLVGASSVVQLTKAALHWPAIDGLLQCAPSFLVLGMLVTMKPRTTPSSVLIILVTFVACQSVMMADHSRMTRTEIGLDSTSLALSILSVIVILMMPLRDPSLPSNAISKPFTDATSSLRSPEDNMTLWQFMTVSWMTPLIRKGFRSQLEDDDVWQLGLEFQHQGLHEKFRRLKGTVMRRLLKANGIDLVIITLLGILETILGFAVPVLLQKILSSMQDGNAPKSAAITYAAISLGVQLIKCQSGVFSLWFGRRCYERSRGEMITMLYEKTLGRKISFNPPKTKLEDDAATGDELNGNGHVKGNGVWSSWLSKLVNNFRQSKKKEEAKEPASMGKILNLMRNDVYEVAQRFWEFQNLVTKPLSVIFSLSLVVNFLGWPAMLAVVVMITAQVTNAILVKFLIGFESHRRKATDGKFHVVSQFVEAIRHLRWYGWQGAWLDQIMSARQKELNWRIVTGLWGLLISFINSLALDLSPSVGFFAYTVIGKKPLTVDVAFPALTLFNLLSMNLQDLPGLITVLLNAYVAVGRIEDFMAEPDKDTMNTVAHEDDSLTLEHATFAWPGTSKPVLRDINISFPKGLTVVTGKVAAGKTALLQALLGELDLLEGKLSGPSEAVGYCAQNPWLQSMSIRENILFSAPYEEDRYMEVLDACELTSDLEQFQAGDASFIGENGIGLSGGQKARVALARAAYSRSKILFLDDPLSALDQQTAESIVYKLFAGRLFEERTVILVTHRIYPVGTIADCRVQLEDGFATASNHKKPPREILQSILPKPFAKKDDQKKQVKKRRAAAAPDKFIEDEHRASGGVKASVYWEYIKAGKLRLWGLLVLMLVAYRLVALSGAWLLKSWGEAYRTESTEFSVLGDPTASIQRSGLFGNLPPPDENIKPWVLVFFLIGLARTVVWAISRAVMILIIYTAGKQMFHDIMVKVSHANFRFYDVTPVGRLMNRMTSDIGVVDGNISEQFNVVTWLAISWISAVAVIATVTPVFLLFSIALTATFIMIFRRFLPTSQSLRRLEMVSLTPLMSNFGELLNGLVTVRAFKAQGRFQDRVIRVVDTFQKMDHFYWSLQGWLMYRYDALSAISTFLLTLLALVTGVSPGMTAFLLNSAQKFVTSTHALCKQYGQLQMEFVSVERVVELLHIDQEPVGNVQPPAWWPSFSGDIVFDNVTVQYAPHLDPALAGVSFKIKGGSKTAVIGRTGSGKSTLALTLLATILPSEGKISIDMFDLAHVDKQILRTRITFLAQDPVLFPGSLRQNLDPLEEHTDAACAAVLERVCSRQGWTLDTAVDGGGRNLSQGQRQLVGLARAVLRRSAIIILDEATASIDQATAMQIQQVLNEEMKESTVITIAHRVDAVAGADYCIVLGKGKILEEGEPHEIMSGTRAQWMQRQLKEDEEGDE